MPRLLWIAGLIALVGLGGGAATAGPLTFQISVDTSSVNGSPGAIELLLTNLDVTALPVTATVSNFTGGAGPFSVAPIPFNPFGLVSGALPGTVTLDIIPNNTVDTSSDVVTNFTYGTSLQFTVTLSGPGVSEDNAAAATGFSVFFYDGHYTNTNTPTAIFRSTDPSLGGAAIGISVPPPNVGPPEVLPAGDGVAVQDVTVPEPAAWLLLGLGAAVSALGRRRV